MQSGHVSLQTVTRVLFESHEALVILSFKRVGIGREPQFLSLDFDLEKKRVLLIGLTFSLYYDAGQPVRLARNLRSEGANEVRFRTN